MYLSGNQNAKVRPLLDAGVLGLMNTPKNGYAIAEGWTWAADNGCFGKGYPGDSAWLGWLGSFTDEQKSGCLFATAPDVVGDHDATLALWYEHRDRITALGFRAAFVLQDGATPWTIPTAEVYFVGGTTAWKLGPEVKAIIASAKARGAFVHVGRVNSGKRFAAFSALGCDSADGTYIGFGPDQNLPDVLAWIRHDATHPPLFKLDTPS